MLIIKFVWPSMSRNLINNYEWLPDFAKWSENSKFSASYQVLKTYFLCLWLLLFPKFSQNLWASLNLVCLSFPCSFSVPFVRFLCECPVPELWGDDVKPESDPHEYSSNVVRKALFFFFFRRPQIEELDEFPDKSPSDFDDGTD